MPPTKKSQVPSSPGRKKRSGQCLESISPLCEQFEECKDKTKPGANHRKKKPGARFDCITSEVQDEKLLEKEPVSVPQTPKERNGRDRIDDRNMTSVRLQDKVTNVDHIHDQKKVQKKTEKKDAPSGNDAPSSPVNGTEDFPFINTNKMSKADLSVLMRKLLKTLALKGTISLRQKPDWWPAHVEWAYSGTLTCDDMIAVIKHCYKAYGKENMISQAPTVVYNYPVKTMYQMADPACRMINLNSSSNDVIPPSPLKSRGFPKDLFLPFTVEIYICYFCEKEFVSKEKMRLHQKQCDERPPELKQPSYITPVIESDVSKSPPQISPKSPNLKLDIDRKYVPLKEFAKNFCLVPCQTASKIRAERKCSEISSEILEEMEPMSPVPATPRTPKSLISQLSKDDSSGNAKKRLSYSLSVDKDRGEDKDALAQEEGESDSETEMEATKPKATNLLKIPVSSLLGQKIKNYVQIDLPSPVVSNSESFCKTPTKNTFLDKLRKKLPSYPITYKPRRIANLDKQNHLYKFTKRQVKDFLGKLNTGLNASSRENLKVLKKVSVRLTRLSDKQMLKWISRRQLDRQLYRKFKKLHEHTITNCPDEFPAGPTLLSKNIDKLLGLKRRSNRDNPSLSLGNFVSEEMEVELSKLQLAVYKSLLYEMSVLKPAVLVTAVKPFERDNSLSDNSRLSSISEKTVDVNQDKQIHYVHSGHKKSFKLDKRFLKQQKGEVDMGSELAKTVLPKQSLPVPTKYRSSGKDTVTNKCETNTAAPKIPAEIETCNSHSLSECKSQCDVSVIPVSLESEAVPSEVGFTGDGHKNHTKCSQVNLDALDQLDTIQPVQDNLNKSDLMKPLTVSVYPNDLLPLRSKKVEEIGGIPSPDSAIDDPTFLNTPPSTPGKSSQVEDSMSRKILGRLHISARSPALSDKISLQDDVKSNVTELVPERVQSLRKSFRSQSLIPLNSPKKDVLKSQKSLPGTPQKNNTSKIKEKFSKQSPLNHRSLRSQSLTPSNSPAKFSFKSSKSLPNSPKKNSSSTEMDGTPKHNNEIRILRKRQQLEKSPSSSPVRSTKNQYSISSGNFLVSSPMKSSPPKQIENSSVQKRHFNLSALTNYNSEQGNVKRLRSSMHNDETRPSKSQKIS